MKSLILAFAFGALVAADARAATADFTDLPDGFDPGPIIRLSGAEAMTLSSPNGFFPTGGILYANGDLDPVTIAFATPVTSVEVVGGLDDLMGWIGGEITISGGGVSQVFMLAAGVPTTLMFGPAAPVSSIMLEVIDTGASATAFIGIESITTTPVPLPGAAILLVGALSLGAVLAGRRAS